MTDATSAGDWRWQLKNQIRRLEDLETRVELTDSERAAIRAAGFGWGISPYYLSLVDGRDPACPIRLQCIPQHTELGVEPGDLRDPLGEDERMAAPGIVHRYPDRALFLTTDRCTVYCRYCTRRRLVGGEKRQLNREEIDGALAYLCAHPQIREVILSGGDPLISGDRFLDGVLGRLREVPSIEVLRIHTRMPVVCPMRITPSLVEVLRRHQPVFLITHFNHPRELTPEACRGLQTLADAGVPLGNQAVLLRGVNDDADTIAELGRGLQRNRVWFYYLHHVDPAQGISHFRCEVSEGVRIIEQLRGRLSGPAIPRFIVDLPGGHGKVALEPDYVAHDQARLALRSPIDERVIVPLV